MISQSLASTEANLVEFSALGGDQPLGTLRQVSPHEWKEDSEKDGRDRFSLTETGRDQWSIHLFDLSRKVSLQIDLFEKVIFYSDPKQPRRKQYRIISSSSRANGWLANRVECKGVAATAGSVFKQVGAAAWTEDKPDGAVAFTFVEMGRDDWSVHLRDPARNLTIQLDLFRLMVVCQVADGPKQDLYPVASALAKVNGWLVNRIDHTDGGRSVTGSFLQTGPKTWVEENAIAGRGKNEFQETNRDEWSVYLHDPSRNVSLQLDLFKATVLYADAKNPQFALYPIARADVLPKLGLDNGKTVNLTTYGDASGKAAGRFRQTSEQTWIETGPQDDTANFHFDEIARDDWSVYLRDESRDTWVQLDLFRNKVSTHQGNAPPGDLYDILSTEAALNGWLVNAVGYDSAPGRPEVLQQVGWTAWIEHQVGNQAIANHFDEIGRDDWLVHLHDPSRDVKLQIDLFRKKIVYSDAHGPPRDLYDISTMSHDAELWRLSHRITSRSSLTEDFDLRPGGKPPAPRPVYRTSITLPIYVTSVEVWASEEVALTINDVAFTIDRVKTVRVLPSAMSKLSVSMPATAIGCATLLLRTNLMQADDFHIVTPDVEAHRKIGGMKPGALYDARSQLGIDDKFAGKSQEVGAVQTAIQNLVSTVQYSYNDTYHGVHRDRGLLPANMDDPHFSLDFSGGGAKYAALTKDQATALTQGARRIASGAALGLLDDIGTLARGFGTVFVHTLDKAGNGLSDTAARVAGDAKQSISAVGEDVVHGDVLGAVGSLFKGGENLGQDLAHGAAGVGGAVAEGAGQLLAVTFKFADSAKQDAIQFLVDATDHINNLIAPLLDQLGAELGKFIAWLLDKVGWDDVLHTHDVLLDAMNHQMDQCVEFCKAVKKKSDNFFNQAVKQLDASVDAALAEFGVEKVGSQPITPAALSGAIEQLENLMGKVAGQAGSPDFALPGLSFLAGTTQGPLGDLVTTLEDKLGSDGGTVLTALGDAAEHVRRMFSDAQHAPVEFLAVVLEIARAVGIVGLDIVSTVVDLLLDAIITAIPAVKAAANAEMTIPFVSSFYEGLAGGRKLTALSLAALLAAIPMTILHKAFEGTRPFADIGAAQGDAASISADYTLMSADEMSWGYYYGACQIVQSATSAIADVSAFAQARAASKRTKMTMSANDDGLFTDAEDPDGRPADLPQTWEISGPEKDPPKMAELSKLQTTFGIINLGLNVAALGAGAPLPADVHHDFQDLSFLDSISLDDKLEDVNFFSLLAFSYTCATTAIDFGIFSATTMATASGVQQTVMDRAQKYIGIMNFIRGIARFSLMSVIYAFDEKKQTGMSETLFMTGEIFQARIANDPIAALSQLRNAVNGNDDNSPVPASSDKAAEAVKANLYLQNLQGYYGWASGTPRGNSEKAFGNCMDAFPEIGQLGTLPALVEWSEGISLAVTTVCDGVAHLAEGITYLVRTHGQRLY